MDACTPDLVRRFLSAVALTAACLCLSGGARAQGPSDAQEDPVFRLNPGTELSEDAEHAAALGAALSRFLGEVRSGACDPEELAAGGFFSAGLRSLKGRPGDEPPTVLKSYSFDGAAYLVTVAFAGEREGAPFLHKVVEFLARPNEDGGYRFSSPFELRIADLRSTAIQDVTYRHAGPLDLPAAKAFVRFRAELIERTGADQGSLEYVCFDSLDELLRAYGFVFDAGKCNFLARDLGFLDHDGARFVTGTGRENYAFEYLGDHLKHFVPNSDQLYWPFVNGMATCYGGYGLSGEGLDELKAQFRARLAEEPDIDFLEEFRRGRKSSVKRHFSYYVMSAFLCERALAERGFEDTLRLAYAGPEGERFFTLLDELLGIDETNFHAAILGMIEARG